MVDFNQRVLRFVKINLLVRKFAERAKLNQQSPCFRRIRYIAAHLAGLKIDIAIRETRWRVKDREQTVTKSSARFNRRLSPVS